MSIEVDREQFVARFIAHMIEHAPFKTFSDGTTVAEYAAEVAPTYWEDPDHCGGESPEECADADISYWGE
jgi:hypothetical protein